MAQTAPRITVIVPAYCPGDGILRVIDSLDAQTLPASEFEVIIVDDGSPDGTFARLEEFASSRPSFRVATIEPSGWPSRPRNVGTAMARGEYLFYMDADDSLYPDALQRIVDFAAETGADVISPKQSKTGDIWWGMPPMVAGNTTDIKAAGDINRLLPMGPTKAYRRDFLREHGVTFPEGRRRLWEDVFFNIEAYAKAERVAVLTDTPVYLYHWEKSDAHISTGYGATADEYWDRLDELMSFVDTTLAGPGFSKERKASLMHLYQGRVLRRLSQVLGKSSADETQVAMARARDVQERYIPLTWDSDLSRLTQFRAVLLRQDRPELLVSLQRSLTGLSGRTQATRVEWTDGVLQIEATSQWQRAHSSSFGLSREGDRIMARLPADVAAAIPPELLDLTDRVHTFSVRFGVRAREELITWQLPVTQSIQVRDLGGGEVALVGHVVSRLDPQSAVYGSPLADTVWDLTTLARWEGLQHVSPVHTSIAPQAALINGRAAVAYANRSGKLTLDLAQRLRSVVADGGPVVGRLPATDQGFSIPLPRAHVAGETRLATTLVLGPAGGTAPGTPLPAWLIGDHDGARLQAEGLPPAGQHRVSTRSAQSTLGSDLVLSRSPQGTLALTRLRRPAVQKFRPRQWIKAVLRRLGR